MDGGSDGRSRRQVTQQGQEGGGAGEWVEGRAAATEGNCGGRLATGLGIPTHSQKARMCGAPGKFMEGCRLQLESAACRLRPALHEPLRLLDSGFSPMQGEQPLKV